MNRPKFIFFYNFTTEIEGSVKPSVFVVEGTFSRKTEGLIDGSLVAVIIALSVVIIFIGFGCFLRIKYKPTKENPESKYMKYFLVKKKRYSECANNKKLGIKFNTHFKEFKEEAGKLLKHDKKSLFSYNHARKQKRGILTALTDEIVHLVG